MSHAIAWLSHLTAQRSIDDLIGKLHDVHNGREISLLLHGSPPSAYFG
jgi:hypothetical protein